MKSLQRISALACCFFLLPGCRDDNEAQTESPEQDKKKPKGELAAQGEPEEEQPQGEEKPEEKPVPADPPIEGPEKEAIEAFAAALEEQAFGELVTKLAELDKAKAENPAAMLEALRAVHENAKAWDIEGLPEDLAKTAQAFQESAAGVATHAQAVPIPQEILGKGGEAIFAWVTKKSKDDPAFGEELQQEMEGWETTMSEVSDRMDLRRHELEEALGKHGIDPQLFGESESKE